MGPFDCLAGAVALVFIYVYTITLFGACLHFIAWTKAMVPSCHANPKAAKTKKNLDFYDKYSALVFKARYIILAGATLSLTAFLVMFFFVPEGLERRRLVPLDSPTQEFFRLEDSDFRAYPYRIQVVIPEPLDYWKLDTKEKISKVLEEFKASHFMSKEAQFEENWLSAFQEYLDVTNSEWPQTREDFISLLQEFIDATTIQTISTNVKIENDEIVASRFLLQTSAVMDATEDAALLLELRAIADRASETLGSPVLVHHFFFPYFDQFLQVKPTTWTSFGSSLACVFVVCLALVPGGLAGALVVLAAVISIECFVFGAMLPWGIHLDVVSMISLIMCVGFSVDFSAHMAHHFQALRSRNSGPSAAEALADSYRVFAAPIVQSCVSTLAGVTPLWSVPSYILRNFFGMMFSVFLVGAMHGLVVVPVMLLLVDACRKPRRHTS